jgi:hypothetical protein
LHPEAIGHRPILHPVERQDLADFFSKQARSPGEENLAGLVWKRIIRTKKVTSQ